MGHAVRGVDVRDRHHPELHDLRGLPPPPDPLLCPQSGLQNRNRSGLEDHVLQEGFRSGENLKQLLLFFSDIIVRSFKFFIVFDYSIFEN